MSIVDIVIIITNSPYNSVSAVSELKMLSGRDGSVTLLTILEQDPTSHREDDYN